MIHESRHRLSEAQSALIRALLAGGAVPAGFDPHRLRVEAAALLAKRRRLVQRLRPDLADALGPSRFTELFDAWATATPRRYGVTARADADAFAAWLASAGHLPGAVRDGTAREGTVRAGWRRARRRARAGR